MKLLHRLYNLLFKANNDKKDRAVTNALSRGLKTILDICDATRLGLGGVYAALNRLEKQGLVWSEWDNNPANMIEGNRRRYYHLR